jgi:hypothetical protein
MADSAHVAEEFLEACTTKDLERARTLLKDSWVTVVFDARPFAPLLEAQRH